MGLARSALAPFFCPDKTRVLATLAFFLYNKRSTFMQKKGKSSAAKKSAPKKRKARKAKVALDSKKLMVLCAVVCASCVLLLAVTAFLSRGNAGAETERKTSVEKIAGAEKSSSAKTEKEKKAEEKKSAQKSGESESQRAKNETPAKSDDKPKTSAVAPTPSKREPSKKEEPMPEKPAPAVPAKTSSETKEQAAGFDFPQAQNGAVLCVVFDDGGQNVGQLKKCVALPFPVTVAVLPRLPHSAESAAIVRNSGNEVILHQPMQAVNLKVNPGAGAIKPDMTANEVQATLSQNIAEISPIAGMNNHEGSLITEDEVLVSFILQTAQEKGIYFLDSRTSSATKIPSVAMEMGMGWYQRDIFLDNKKTRENYLAELKKGLDIANKKGHVIMIGHVWSAESLPAFLEEAYPELALKGWRFATVSKSGGMYK